MTVAGITYYTITILTFYPVNTMTVTGTTYYTITILTFSPSLSGIYLYSVRFYEYINIISLNNINPTHFVVEAHLL